MISDTTNTTPIRNTNFNYIDTFHNHTLATTRYEGYIYPRSDNMSFAEEKPLLKQISLNIQDKNPRITFYFELLKLLQELNNSNVIVSPSSIIRTLTLLSLGVSGTTKQKIVNLFDKINIKTPKKLLSTANSIDANDSLLPSYLARIKEKEINSKTSSWLTSVINKFWSLNDETARLDTLNAVLTDEGFPLSDNMKKRLAVLKAVAGDQLLSSNTFIKDINEIFAIKTNGKVQKIVKQGDFTGTEIAILNAIHFYGKWQSAFTLDKTYMSFSLFKSRVIAVKSMSLKTTIYKIAKLENWQAIRLLYKGDKYAMDIILPPKEITTENNNIKTSVVISQLIILLNSKQNISLQQEINIQMPLFSFSSEINLLDIMKQHPELKTLTSPKLNLNEMIQGGYEGAITKVLQRCYIDVNEVDTTANAVTEMSVSKGIDYVQQFCVNRPFYFSIYDIENNDIAMAGFVQEPSINKTAF